MIDAVGWQYFDTLFRRCGELLSPGGLMLLQAIVIDHGAYHVERSSRSFVRELIFPSGCLPSLELISDCVVRGTEMGVLDVEDITGQLSRDAAALARGFPGRRRTRRPARLRPALPAAVGALLLVLRGRVPGEANPKCRHCWQGRASGDRHLDAGPRPCS
jgi:hypothetical protein